MLEGSVTDRHGPGRRVNDDITVRPAVADDATFLVEMLAEAADWRVLDLAEPAAVIDQPDLARYVVGWPRPDDLGIIALAGDRRIGGAWLRFFAADDAAYGFVGTDVPELAVAVVDRWRGRGIGRVLLAELAAAAQRRGIGAISLSVRRTNPAAALYRRAGYRVVAQGPDSDTMVKHLPAGDSATPDVLT